MSILDTLLKFIDPIEHHKKQEDRRRKREALPPDVDPDEIDEVLARPAARAPLMECRVCHHRGTGKFCPDCLAQTMVPVRARP
jgi:hypothetical protein